MTARKTVNRNGTIGALSKAAFLLLAAVSIGQSEDFYEVRGTIREEILYPQNRVQDFNFTCRVIQGGWWIQLDATSANPVRWLTNQTNNRVGQLKLPDSELACSDGTNFYVVKKARFDAVQGRPESEGMTGIIGAGAVPFGSLNDRLIVVWYAFASARYLAGRPIGELFPLHALSYRDVVEGRWRASANWELLPNAPGLPRWIQTSNYSGWTPALAFTKDSFPHTNVDFVVSAATNFNGLTLPTAVAANYYFSASNQNSLVVIHSKKISLNGVAFAPFSGAVKIPPPMKGVANFSDTRRWIADRPSQVVALATNEWPSESTLKKRYEMAGLHQDRKAGIPSRSGPLIFRVLLVSSGLVSLIGLILLSRRIHPKT